MRLGGYHLLRHFLCGPGAFSLGVLLYAPGTLAVGFLIDRIGTRVTMLGGCALLAASLGLVATATPATSWQMLVGWSVAAGPAAACLGYTPIMKLLSTISPARLGRAMGVAMMGQGISPLLVGPAMQSLTDLQGWNVAIAIFAAFALLLILPLALTVAPARPSLAVTHLGRFSISPASRDAHRWAFWLLLGGFFCLGYLLLIPTYLVAYLIEIDVEPYTAAITAGLFGVLTSLGATMGGWMADRWGLLQVLGSGAALLAVGSAALFDVFPRLLVMLAWYVVIAGLGRGMIGIAVSVAQARTFSGVHFGRITGILDVGFSVGASLGVWLTIVARDRLGSYQPSLASAVVAGALIALLLAFATSTRTSRCHGS